MEKVFRKENKYLLNYEEFKKYTHYLEQILTSDPHNGHDGYIVRSLYFDTLDNKDFHQKEMGIELRRKIRLRIYNPKDNFAMLEIKQKQGDNQLKRSLKIYKDEIIQVQETKIDSKTKIINIIIKW